MNFKKRIQNCLLNENGGPNLENLIGIGTSILCFVALWSLKDALYSSIQRIMHQGATY